MINDQIIILGRLVVVSPAPTDINPLCITALLDQRECRLPLAPLGRDTDGCSEA